MPTKKVGRTKPNGDMPQRFWDDREWGYAHYGSLAKRFGNRWVAIVNRKAVAASRSIKEVEDAARAKTGERHVPVIFVELGRRIRSPAAHHVHLSTN